MTVRERIAGDLFIDWNHGVSSAFRGVSACVTCVSAASSIGDCRSTVSTGSGSESAAHRSPSSHCTSRCASELSRTACAAARRS